MSKEELGLVGQVVMQNSNSWIGEIKDSVANGFGICINSKGKICYVGYAEDGEFSDYGIEFYAEDGEPTIKYDGFWKKGRHEKCGYIFDTNDNISVKENRYIRKENFAFFFNNYKLRRVADIKDVNELYLLSEYVETVRIPSNSLNEITELDLKNCHYLNSFILGDNCCKMVKSFTIREALKLSQLIIGNDCFSDYDRSQKPQNRISLDLSALDDKTSIFSVENCCLLVRITIGNGSFVKYTQFLLSNLPILNTLEVGSSSSSFKIRDSGCCFFAAKEVTIQDLPKLETVLIGNYCFMNSKSLTIGNCSNLKSFEIGYNGLNGCEELRLMYLPILPTIQLHENTLFYCYSIYVLNCPALDSIACDGVEYLTQVSSIKCAKYSKKLMNSLYERMHSIGVDITFLEIPQSESDEYQKSIIQKESSQQEYWKYNLTKYGSIDSVVENYQNEVKKSNEASASVASKLYKIKPEVFKREYAAFFLETNLTPGDLLSSTATDLQTTMSDFIIHSMEDWSNINEHIRSLIIEDNQLNEFPSISFRTMVNIEKLHIGDQCLQSVTQFDMNNFPNLKEIIIGEDCFNAAKKGEEQKATISTNNSLETIIIGNGSFRYYSCFDISLLNFLKVLKIGTASITNKVPTEDEDYGCFSRATEFKITGFLMLNHITFGNGTFRDVSQIKLENFTKLKEIQLGSYALSKCIVYQISGCLTLRHITLYDHALQNCQRLVLTKLPYLVHATMIQPALNTIKEINAESITASVVNELAKSNPSCKIPKSAASDEKKVVCRFCKDVTTLTKKEPILSQRSDSDAFITFAILISALVLAILLTISLTMGNAIMIPVDIFIALLLGIIAKVVIDYMHKGYVRCEKCKHTNLFRDLLIKKKLE